MSNEVNGPAPPVHQAKLEIVRVDWIEQRQFVCVSPVPWTKNVHWVGGRSEECKQPNDCKRCNEGERQKWHMYIQCMDATGKHGCFLEVTATAYHMFALQLHKDKDWRGLMFRIGKTKGGKKGRFRIEVLERRVDPRDLPQSFDPIGILRFLWTFRRKERLQEYESPV